MDQVDRCCSDILLSQDELAKIAEQMLSGNAPKFEPVPEIYAGECKFEDQDGTTSNIMFEQALQNIYERSKRNFTAELAEIEALTKTLRTLPVSGSFDEKRKINRRRDALFDIIYQTKPVISKEGSGPVALMQNPFLGVRTSSYHAITNCSEKLSILILTGLIDVYPKQGIEIVCIPPTLLDMSDIAEIYDKRVVPSSQCIFDEREYPRLFGEDKDGIYILEDNDILPASKIPTSLYTSTIFYHVTPYPYAALTYQDSSEYLPPCPRMSALITPNDSKELRDTAYMLDSQMRRGYYQQRARRIAASYSVSHLPLAVQELIKRSYLMYPLWECALDEEALNDESLDFNKAYDMFGMENFLEAVVSGVPLDDVVA